MFLTEPVLLWILAAIFGLCVGSFLNVVIVRWPRGESVVKPRSRCPHCGAPIRFYDNIPLLSWLMLGGKCRRCKGPISFRYFLVEGVTALLSLAVYAHFREVLPYAVFFLLFVAPMITVFFIDLEHRLIPDVITLPGIPVGVAVHFWEAPLAWGTQFLWESLIGIAVGGGFLFLVAWGYEKIKKREGLGMGDVKLAAMFGAFFGWKAVVIILLMASLFGSVIGLAVIALKRNWRYALPFGPFLVAAALLYFFFPEMILLWILKFQTLLHSAVG